MRNLLLIVVIAWHVRNMNFAMGQRAIIQSKSSNHCEDSLIAFAAKSFKFIAKDSTKNLVYSPFAAWTVLLMATYGSAGRTHLQLRSALALPNDDMEIVRGVRAMIEDFSNFEDYELRSASNVFINKGYEVNDNFTRFTRFVFRSSPHVVDFTNSLEASRVIDGWGSKQTNKRINDLGRYGIQGKETKIFLANAVNFKGSWDHQFPFESTMPMQFHVTEYKIDVVATMRIIDDFVYGELPNAKATFVKIPYKTKCGAVGLSMFVILPHHKNGLATLLENFEQDFVRLFDTHRKRNIDLHLPKFMIRSSIELKDSLIQMGSNDMFGVAANFTPMSSNGPLWVSEIAQKAFFDVDEAGSDAVAISRYRSDSPKLRQRKTMSFLVDHPFVCVMATDKKIPLFTAVINNPNE